MDNKILFDEPQAVAERYARRNMGDRYSMLHSEVWQTVQERQRAILKLFSGDLGLKDLTSLKLIEVGCGSGSNLLDFIRLGFVPQNLCGIELLPERATLARQNLPSMLKIYEGDANSIDILSNSQDMVFQSVVFSSLLDDCFERELANHMWQWVKTGGGLLWYDFIYNNPSNPDVRGVPMKRVRELFPDGKMIVRRVTLAPPISRKVCRIHPLAYNIFNAIPCLRTHVLCWIGKQ
jgi:SAM-dependent methyltransferase